jgi:diguanylate cyclase (GGDEF)-like protein
VRAYRGSEIYSSGHRDLIFFLVDIDHFKEVNDRFGHDAGDRVLIQIARRLASVVRESDFLIRWGGEEFLVVCRSAERGDGAHMASRILRAIGGTEFDLGNERRLTRSCSVGWAAFPWLPASCSTLSVDEVLRLADRGLYLAKQQGRNQSVGVVATTDALSIHGQHGSSKYHCMEQLLEDNLIREIRTPGEKAAGAAV